MTKPRSRKTPIQQVLENLPRLTIDELDRVANALVGGSPKQARALGESIVEALESSAPGREAPATKPLPHHD